VDATELDSPVAQNETGDWRWRTGRLQQAEDAYNQARARLEKLAERFPEVPDYKDELTRSWLGLSLVRFGAGQPDEAEQAHRRAFEYTAELTSDRRRALAHLFLNLLPRDGWGADPGEGVGNPRRFPELQRLCAHALELAPDDPALLCDVALWCGDAKKAIALLSRAIELAPRIPLFWSNRAMHHEGLGQLDKALADYTRALELNPEGFLMFNLPKRAALYARLKQWDLAITDWSRVTAMWRGDPEYWQLRGSAYDGKGEPAKALADYTKAADLSRKGGGSLKNTLVEPSASIQAFRGNGFTVMGMWEQAAAEYAMALEQWPRSTLVRINRARCNLRLGRAREARADYEKLLELDPGMAEAHNELAWLLATCPDPALRDPRRAVEAAAKAVDLRPRQGAYRNTLGVAHYRAGDGKAAIEALTKSMELRQEGDAFDWLFLAMAHRQLGHRDEARRWYDKAVEWMEEARPKDEELHRFRSEAAAVLRLPTRPK
jgi:tetratricopeptide (TPR) repeat protein